MEKIVRNSAEVFRAPALAKAAEVKQAFARASEYAAWISGLRAEAEALRTFALERADLAELTKRLVELDALLVVGAPILARLQAAEASARKEARSLEETYRSALRNDERMTAEDAVRAEAAQKAIEHENRRREAKRRKHGG